MIAIATLAMTLHLLAVISEPQKSRAYVRHPRKPRPPFFIVATNGAVL